MRIPGRRYRDEWISNDYGSRTVGDVRVRISRCGRFILLDPSEDDQINELYMDDSLFERLERTGHIITERNSADVFAALREWQRKTYEGPALHIVAVTKRCNLNCTYCHMLPVPVSANKERSDMSPETARAVVRFIMETPNPKCSIEFQGGEPFINFDAVRTVVQTAKELADDYGKRVKFSLVSNLLVGRNSDLDFCAENDISISFTLNGNRAMHDLYRITRSGKGTFDAVMKRVREIQKSHPGLLSASPLCTVGTETAEELIEMIDFFYDAGFEGVSLQKLKRLGNAVTDRLAFDMDHFIEQYLRTVDYMYEKNKASVKPYYSERSIRVVLSKMLGDSDVGFVDWRNPNGDATMTLTYDHDGEILPSDEARSLRDEFTLGNVHQTSYDELTRKRSTYRSSNLSIRDRDPECRACAYNPYCGVLPIVEFADSGNASPRPYESENCRFVLAVLDWTLKKYAEDPVPLLKMLPGIESSLTQYLQQAVSVGDTAHAENR